MELADKFEEAGAVVGLVSRVVGGQLENVVKDSKEDFLFRQPASTTKEKVKAALGLPCCCTRSIFGALLRLPTTAFASP